MREGGAPAMIPMRVRRRANGAGAAGGSGLGSTGRPDAGVEERLVHLDPARAAIVIIDMWNYHWCRTWVGRAGAMIPRMNRALDVARRLGMAVIHAPTDGVTAYSGIPQRERMAALPRTPISVDRRISVYPVDELAKGTLRPTYYDGDMCGGPFDCIVNYGNVKLDERVDIGPEDWISASAQDVYNLCERDGIQHLIYFGGATNVCILGKLEGMIQMSSLGLDCVIARDLTEAQSVGPDSAALDDNTAKAVAFIEEHIGGSVDFVQTLIDLGRWEGAWRVDQVLVKPWGLESRPQVFEDAITVTMSNPRWPGADIHYTLDGGEPTPGSTMYSGSFTLKQSAVLRAAAYRNGDPVSLTSESHYVRIPPLPPTPDVFVSDLTPTWSSAMAYISWWSAPERGSDPPPARDRSYDGSQLTLRGQRYEKGLGVNAPSQVVYDLSPDFGWFVGCAGVCESLLSRDLGRAIASLPRVAFKVFIDGELAGESRAMMVSEVPWRFRIAIPEHSRVISLAATTPAEGGSHNLGNWVNAGFIRRR